jgi:hypothetical protein
MKGIAKMYLENSRNTHLPLLLSTVARMVLQHCRMSPLSETAPRMDKRYCQGKGRAAIAVHRQWI